MTHAIMLTPDTRDAIVNAAASAPDREICGLLVECDGGVEAHQTPNRHPRPNLGFAVCDKAHASLQREARARGARIIGCFHSHPSGNTAPSQTDLLAVNEDGFVWLICAADGGMQAWCARSRNGVKWFEPLTLRAKPKG